MNVYADTSALAKRYTAEPHFEETRDAFDAWYEAGDALISSTIAWIEISRLARRIAPAEVARVERDCLAGISEVPVSPFVVSTARRVGPVVLRSLDAIHLASAIISDADLVVTFDERLASACRGAGLPLWRPAGLRP